MMDNLEDSVIEFDHSVNRIVWKNADGKIVGFEPGPPIEPKGKTMPKQYAHDDSTYFDRNSNAMRRGHPIGKDLRRAIDFGMMEIVHHGGLMKMRDPEDQSILVEQRYLFDQVSGRKIGFGPLETTLEALYRDGWRLRVYASRGKLRHGRSVPIRLMKPGSHREPGLSFRIGKVPSDKLMDHHVISLLPFLPPNINVINRVQHEVVESMTADTILDRYNAERSPAHTENNHHRLDPRYDNEESGPPSPTVEIDRRIYEDCGNATFLETIQMALPQSRYLKNRRPHPLQ